MDDNERFENVLSKLVKIGKLVEAGMYSMQKIQIGMATEQEIIKEMESIVSKINEESSLLEHSDDGGDKNEKRKD